MNEDQITNEFLLSVGFEPVPYTNLYRYADVDEGLQLYYRTTGTLYEPNTNDCRDLSQYTTQEFVRLMVSIVFHYGHHEALQGISHWP